jgi:hypothetical protein
MMFSSRLASGSLLLLFALQLFVQVNIASEQGPASAPASGPFIGYLISTFSDTNPKVQLHLSRGNDPGSYDSLNRGKAVLVSSVGTKAVRDVFLAGNGDRTAWFMIGTGISQGQ